MKKLYFILIPAAFANALAVAESFKSKEFNDLKEIPEAVNQALNQEEDEEDEEDEEVLVMSLSAFTDFYNESFSAAEYFITPVYVV